MTRQQAIFVLENVDAHGLADDAKRIAIEALKTLEEASSYEEKLSYQTDGINDIARATLTIDTSTYPIIVTNVTLPPPPDSKFIEMFEHVNKIVPSRDIVIEGFLDWKAMHKEVAE